MCIKTLLPRMTNCSVLADKIAPLVNRIWETVAPYAAVRVRVRISDPVCSSYGSVAETLVQFIDLPLYLRSIVMQSLTEVVQATSKLPGP